MKAHEPTDDLRSQVLALAKVGVPQVHIAKLIGINSDATLRKHYEHELALGKATQIKELCECAHARAMAGSETMHVFLLKTQAGFKESADSNSTPVHQFQIVLTNDRVKPIHSTDNVE